MAVQYSPLCDVSLPAYLAYCISNGQRTFGNDVGCGTEGDTRRGSRVGDNGGGVNDVVADDVVTRQAWLGVVRSYCDVINGVGGICGGVAQFQCGSEGAAGGRTGDCDSGFVGSHGNGGQAARAGDENSHGVSSGPDGAETLELTVEDGKVEVKQGRWRARNARKKKLKREKAAVGTVEVGNSEESPRLVAASCSSGLEWRKNSKPVGETDTVVTGRCETVYSSGASTLADAEVEARKTLAWRRVAENKLAKAKAEALAASYADEAKTEALQELSVLRIAQRANEARAKSQSSWKKCEESLGSLGSTGSAGEYWMKKEVEKGKQWEKKYLVLRKQSEHMYANVTQQVRDELLAMDGTVTSVDSGCVGELDDVDDYLAQNIEVAGKDLATMEEEFRNFKF